METDKPIIVAAGGIVTNDNGELLMIFRRGKWDLPKGKLDPGESIEECAEREVMEETGVRNLELGQLIAITEHVYFDKYVQKEVVKKSHWYQMKVAGSPKLIAQTEEDITAIEWTKPEDIQVRLLDSYDTIREVLEKSGIKY